MRRYRYSDKKQVRPCICEHGPNAHPAHVQWQAPLHHPKCPHTELVDTAMLFPLGLVRSQGRIKRVRPRPVVLKFTNAKLTVPRASRLAMLPYCADCGEPHKDGRGCPGRAKPDAA